MNENEGYQRDEHYRDRPAEHDVQDAAQHGAAHQDAAHRDAAHQDAAYVEGVAAAPALTKDVQNMGMLCHLLAFAGYVVPPVGHIIGPLVIWLLKKDEHPFIDDQGKESLNFQISMTIYVFVSGILVFVFIGILLVFGLLIANVVLIIIASIKAAGGEYYRYPMTIRFLK